MSVFVLDDVGYRYPGASASALDAVSAHVERGRIFAVVGPNGAGKSTLLKLMLGALRPTRGNVLYEDRAVTSWRRGELAVRIGVVPQIESLTFPVTVHELVAMGRYPHLGLWRPERAADRDATLAALERCDLGALEARAMTTLSGGERQRARIARALAQEPAVLVLDEPTAALDVRHEMSIFELLHGISHTDGVTVVMVTHNLNLASRFADRLLLLDHGRVAAHGPPAEVVRADVLEAVYRWPLAVADHPGPGPDAGSPQVVPLWRSVDGPAEGA